MALELIECSVYDLETRTITKTGLRVISIHDVAIQCRDNEDWLLGWWHMGQTVGEIGPDMRPIGLEPGNGRIGS